MFSVCSMFKVLFDEHVTEHQTTINKAIFHEISIIAGFQPLRKELFAIIFSEKSY